MKKIAIIGANDFQNPLILKAKELGYETHVFAWQDGSIGEKTADFFYPISIIEKEKILEKCIEIGIDGITTIASDLATVTVNYVASKMGLVGNTIECNKKSTNKYEMRKALKNFGVPTVNFKAVSSLEEIDDIDMNYPLIVKPTDRSGSRAITKVMNIVELKDAVIRAIDSSFEKRAIVEEYIDGKEYSAEGISFNGKHKFLTITKKLTTGSPNFIETGHIEPSGLTDETKGKIYLELEKALNALEITNSATHSEFKITESGEVRIIEIGARMGGDCIGSDLVEISTGLDYLKMVIDVCMGIEPKFEIKSEPKIAAVKFILNQSDRENYEKMLEFHNDLISRASEIEDVNIHEVVDSSTRFGFYNLKADTLDEIGWLFNDGE
ncbi:MAG: ATP-grasp domain-containing protein [Clostridia bacterium]|nr:ATP-grasp domain-containing protein [Clostridia bacterium]